jgi:hypothetical protein
VHVCAYMCVPLCACVCEYECVQSCVRLKAVCVRVFVHVSVCAYVLIFYCNYKHNISFGFIISIFDQVFFAFYEN